jgi:hypothetical protein
LLKSNGEKSLWYWFHTQDLLVFQNNFSFYLKMNSESLGSVLLSVTDLDSSPSNEKEPNLTLTETKRRKKLAREARLPGERTKVVSTIMKLSIVYLMAGGIMTFYGTDVRAIQALSHPVTMTPLVVGLVAWVAPFAVVYSITGNRRPMVFKFTGLVFATASLAFLGKALLDYHGWQACSTTFVCAFQPTDYFNELSVYAIAAIFIVLSVVFIRYDGQITKCPICKSQWARSPSSDKGRKYKKCLFCDRKQSTISPVKRPVRIRPVISRIAGHIRNRSSQ